MLSCFDHATIAVSDLERAVRDYQLTLGAPPTWRGEHVGLGTRAAIFGFGNGMVELLAPIPGDPRAAGLENLLSTQRGGLLALAFGTEDAEACRSWLRERQVGVAPVEAGQACDAEGGARREYRTLELNPRQTRGLSVVAVERRDRERLLEDAGRRSPGVLSAIDHVVVRTSDPDAAIGLWRDQLGIRLALDREVKQTRMLFFRIGGVTVEFVRASTPSEQDQLRGLAYRVTDLDAAHARMRAAGIEVSDPREGNKPGTRVYTVRSSTCGVPTLVLSDPSR